MFIIGLNKHAAGFLPKMPSIKPLAKATTNLATKAPAQAAKPMTNAALAKYQRTLPADEIAKLGPVAKMRLSNPDYK